MRQQRENASSLSPAGKAKNSLCVVGDMDRATKAIKVDIVAGRSIVTMNRLLAGTFCRLKRQHGWLGRIQFVPGSLAPRCRRWCLASNAAFT
jgi:hypothetical protein